MLRPLNTTDLIEISNWCREWHRWQVGRVNSGSPLERFAIGFYQMKDVLRWGLATRARYESVAAAIIHFITVLEVFSLPIEQVLALDLAKEEYVSLSQSSAWHLLQDLASAQRQVMYGHKGNFTDRAKTRFRGDELLHYLGGVIKLLVRSIDPACRAQAFEDATHIMVGGKI